MTDNGLRFTKAHRTENDFVLVPDLDGTLDLSAEQVRLLADRRAGVGGDGVIRVVPTDLADEAFVRSQGGRARWFMDYRNADGSADEFEIATRAGVKTIRFEGHLIAVNLGDWKVADPDAALADGYDALVKVAHHDPMPGLSLDLGNPHTVVALPDTADLAGLDLTRVPEVNPLPPQGTNVEFVRPLGPGHIAMRVHERGVGETRSCGTGAAAAALATRWWAGESEDTQVWRVDVPGGTLRVRALPGQQVELAGPAVLVADGVLTP